MELPSSTSLHHQQQQQMMIPLIKTTHDDDAQQVATKSNKLEDTKKEEEEEDDDGLLMAVRKEERVKYKECMRNHAASIGGNARDGCGEFMPQRHDHDDDVTNNEAMYCSVCSCHRNFHRKELLVQNINNNMIIRSRNMNNLGYPTMGHHHHPMIMSYNHHNPIIMGSHQHEDHGNDEDGMKMRRGGHNGNGNGNSNKKRRFRTKFSKEQREKMVGFAERVGWKIQKQEESVVQRFCEEIGVKKRVLKVWMHNNKHTLANKIPLPSSTA